MKRREARREKRRDVRRENMSRHDTRDETRCVLARLRMGSMDVSLALSLCSIKAQAFHERRPLLRPSSRVSSRHASRDKREVRDTLAHHARIFSSLSSLLFSSLFFLSRFHSPSLLSTLSFSLSLTHDLSLSLSLSLSRPSLAFYLSHLSRLKINLAPRLSSSKYLSYQIPFVSHPPNYPAPLLFSLLPRPRVCVFWERALSLSPFLLS